MARSSWSPSPSPSSSSSSNTSSYQNRSSQFDKISAKCLVEEIPLVPPPVINCNNLSLLENTEFVNVVFENPSSENACFRVSDENNQEVCLIRRCQQAESQPAKKGVKYLECLDLQGNCVLYVAYPVGLGEVALLSPSEQLIGECQSNVEFICLSVKVKYNFFDANGNRRMKMTAIMPEVNSGDKFMLMVKRSKKEKLALIKMGSLKSCCHIKFKVGHISVLERLQIIALWAGFMHNELQDTETPVLLEKHAQVKQKEKESHRIKSFTSRPSKINIISKNCEQGKSSQSSDTNLTASSNANLKNLGDNPVVSGNKSDIDNKNGDTNAAVAATKQLKSLASTRHRNGVSGNDLRNPTRSSSSDGKNDASDASNNNNNNVRSDKRYQQKQTSSTLITNSTTSSIQTPMNST